MKAVARWDLDPSRAGSADADPWELDETDAPTMFLMPGASEQDPPTCFHTPSSTEAYVDDEALTRIGMPVSEFAPSMEARRESYLAAERAMTPAPAKVRPVTSLPVMTLRPSRRPRAHVAPPPVRSPLASVHPPLEMRPLTPIPPMPPRATLRSPPPPVLPMRSDSVIDTPWIMSSRSSSVSPVTSEPWRPTLAVVAAALMTLIAIGGVVAGILFVWTRPPSQNPLRTVGRSTEHRPLPESATGLPATKAAMPVVAPAPPSAAPTSEPVIDIGEDAPPPATIQTAPKTARPVAPSSPVAAPTPVAAKTDVPAPSTKRAAPTGAKSVEELLDELGEEQLRR